MNKIRLRCLIANSQYIMNNWLSSCIHMKPNSGIGAIFTNYINPYSSVKYKNSQKFFCLQLSQKPNFDYPSISEETLIALTSRFESFEEFCDDLNYDVTYSDGVLTVNLPGKGGSYVINKQAPNTQIWLSSPVSGPKRYDFRDDKWIYALDGTGLHDLLQREVPKLLNIKHHINFKDLPYS